MDDLDSVDDDTHNFDNRSSLRFQTFAADSSKRSNRQLDYGVSLRALTNLSLSHKRRSEQHHSQTRSALLVFFLLLLLTI